MLRHHNEKRFFALALDANNFSISSINPALLHDGYDEFHHSWQIHCIEDSDFKFNDR